MVVSADFEKQRQYFDKKIVVLSLYRFIAILLYRNLGRQNCPCEESLLQIIFSISKSCDLFFMTLTSLRLFVSGN
jgi:hypothetical protein